jgi:hypothetical protein
MQMAPPLLEAPDEDDDVLKGLVEGLKAVSTPCPALGGVVALLLDHLPS